jgi:hypothetical protein
MTSLVSRARTFALAAHGDQEYGSHPYHVHLDAVAHLARPYGEQAQAIAYLHDVAEDTEVGIGAITEAFGAFIAECVAVLTDAPGSDRKERKRKTYERMAGVSGDLELALVVKAADRVANMRACVADGRHSLLAVYKGEHATFRGAAYRPDLCGDLWHEMEQISASGQHGGYNFRFYRGPELYPLIRRRHRPGELHDPEIPSSGGAWVTAPRSVLDAIHGLGDDVWSGPDWFAEPTTPEQAQAFASERGIDLFGENSEPEP